LEIESQRSVQVRANPVAGVASLHRRLTSIDDFDHDPRAYRIPLVHDSGWMDALPDALGPELRAEIDPFSDRILHQRIQRFESKIYKFGYATRAGEGVIAVTGDPPGVLSESSWRPLTIRLFAALGLGVFLFIVSSIVESGYSNQAQWFQAHGNGPEMALWGFAAAIAGGVALAGNLLPAQARSFARAKLPLGLLCLAWSVIGVLHVIGGPTIVGVQTALDGRDLYAAAAEIEALEGVGFASGDLDDARAQLEAMRAEELRQKKIAEDEAHLDRVRAASSSVGAAAALELDWNDPEQASVAREAVLAKAESEVDTLFESTDETGLLEVALAVQSLDASLAAKARSRGVLSQAEVCHRRGEVDCVITSLKRWEPVEADDVAVERRDVLRRRVVSELTATIASAEVDQDDLGARLTALEKADADVLRLEQIAPEESPPRSRKSLQRLLERAQAAEKQRKEAEARAARRAAQRAAKEQARIRRNADRVRCCDGSGSGCRYSQGSLRGCCSHHGGIC